MTYIRSFLKWAGSKHQVLNHIISELNTSSHGRLIKLFVEPIVEPIVGSGMVCIYSNRHEFNGMGRYNSLQFTTIHYNSLQFTTIRDEV